MIDFGSVDTILVESMLLCLHMQHTSACQLARVQAPHQAAISFSLAAVLALPVFFTMKTVFGPP